MVERFALLAKLPALLSRAEIRPAAVLLAGAIDLDAVVRDADDAHELALRLVVAACDAGSERNVLGHDYLSSPASTGTCSSSSAMLVGSFSSISGSGSACWVTVSASISSAGFGTSEAFLMSTRQPVSLAARRAF